MRELGVRVSQGFALGYYVLPLWGRVCESILVWVKEKLFYPSYVTEN